MKAWFSVTLGEVLELKRGYDLPSSQRRAGTIPVMTSSGIGDFHNVAKITGPGVVTGRYGTIGKIFFTKQDFWPLNTSLYVRDFKGNDPRFCYYFLKTLDWSKFNDKSGVPGINRNDVHGEPVSVPPLAEQRKIVATLGALDDKIELNRKMAATLEEMARALYRSWFVDFDPVRARAEGRAPAHMDAATAALFPDSFGEDGLPVGWKNVGLMDVVDLISGGTPKTDRAEFWGGNIQWASAKDVSQCGNMFLTETERTITEAGLRGSSTKIVPAFATVVVARGATTGRYSMFGSDIAMNQTCYALRSRNEADFYVNGLLSQVIPRIIQAAHGSVFDTITSKTLSATSVVSPPAEVIAAHEMSVRPFFKKILALSLQSGSLATLRDTLLPRLMSGELRVGAVRKVVEESV